jgi:hypothetical protein
MGQVLIDMPQRCRQQVWKIELELYWPTAARMWGVPSTNSLHNFTAKTYRARHEQKETKANQAGQTP